MISSVSMGDRCACIKYSNRFIIDVCKEVVDYIIQNNLIKITDMIALKISLDLVL